MHLQLNEDQKMIQESARDFAAKFVAPKAKELDETQKFPTELVGQAAEMGFMGVAIPEQYGGSGLDYVSYCCVIEEVARYCGSTSVILSVNNSLACEPYDCWNRSAEKEWLTPLASGQKLGCFGLTEPNSGSDCGSMKTNAVKKGNDWVINGAKIWITCGTDSDTFIVFTITDAAAGNRGIAAFIMDRSTPGLSVLPMRKNGNQS